MEDPTNMEKEPGSEGYFFMKGTPSQDEEPQSTNESEATNGTEEAASLPLTDKKPVEEWIKIKKVYAPVASALMRLKKWGFGKMLTEAEFDKALSELSKKPVAGNINQ